ncbi:MAG: MFS transporter [Gammaproteobacteria bacterium]|nr:MFS transporter [Gammaproteobacteria bacterium]MDH3506615.1 MFS transporter [Gammaproteobacteria bacterium]
MVARKITSRVGGSQPINGNARAIWSWALYDFANSPFSTLVVTFVFGTYFTQAIASDPIVGTALWSRAMTITALIVAICSPVLGALADRGGYRKAFVLIFTLICVVATTALYGVLPGQVMAALVLVVIANIAYEFAAVFYNAFLPDIAPRERIGRVSGLGWGLGYIGGLAALGVALVTLVQPETPWFGFSREAGENIRATNLLVAAWLLVFSIPLMIWVTEDRSEISKAGQVLVDTAKQLTGTFSEIRRYRQIVRFLIARLIFNDGLVTIFAFGGIYAAETFGFSLEEVLIFGIVLNVAAGSGALLMGHLDDWIGGKRTVVLSLIGLIVATLLAVFATTRLWFWVAGIIIGVFVGPNQAASRSLMSRFVPPRFENEFFGFFAFSGKLTAFMGPFLLGVLTQLTGSQRVGVAAVLGFFVVGLALMLTVDEEEAIMVAGRS